MGQSLWDDIKSPGHCIPSVCLYVCLRVLNGTISKFWAVPCSSKCVYYIPPKFDYRSPRPLLPPKEKPVELDCCEPGPRLLLPPIDPCEPVPRPLLMPLDCCEPVPMLLLPPLDCCVPVPIPRPLLPPLDCCEPVPRLLLPPLDLCEPSPRALRTSINCRVQVPISLLPPLDCCEPLLMLLTSPKE